MIVREFITKLAFDADDRKVGKFDRAVKGLVVGLTAAVAAAGAMSAAAFKLANDTARYGDELAKTADRLGLTTDALQELRFAADRSGVAQRTLEMALQRMTRRLSEAAQGSGEAQNAIAELGLDAEALASMTPDQALDTLSDALAGVENQSERVRLAFKFFDSEGVALLNMLGDGSEEVQKLRDEFERLGGGLTEDQARGAEDFRDSLTSLQAVMQNIRLQIGAKLMPVLRPMIEQFTEFLVQNREIISARIGQAFEVIVSAIGNLKRVADGVVGLFRPIVNVFNDMGPAGKAAAASLLLLVRRFRPFFILAAIVGALEDIGAWMNGQPSLIENLLGPYEDFAESVNEVVESLGGLERVTNMVIGLLLAKWAWGVAAGMFAAAAGVGVLGGALAILAKNPVMRLLLGTATLTGNNEITGEGPTQDLSLDKRLGANEGETIGETIMNGIKGLLGFDGETPEIEMPSSSGPSDRSGFVPDLPPPRELQMNFEQNITVPPGSTTEQISFIRRETERTMAREVDRAAKALEA